MNQLGACLIFMLFFRTVNVSGQEIVRFVETYTVEKTAPYISVTFEALLPRTIPGKQEVLNINFSKEPDIITNKGVSDVGFWDLGEMTEKDELKIDILIKIYQRGFDTYTKKPSLLDRKSREQYLKNERYIQKKNKSIKRKAEELRDTSESQSVRNIFEFVKNHMTYKNFKKENRGAKKALKQGLGDCTEYSELMVALCRSIGIPARIVIGKSFSRFKVGYHNWVEVFLEEKGWVPFDPTWSDSNARTSFEMMTNSYVYYDYKSDATFFKYRHSGARNQFKLNRQSFCALPLRLLRNQAIYNYNRGELERAGGFIDSLINLNPEETYFYQMKGVLKARQKKFDEALVNLQFALKQTKNPREKSYALYAFSNFFALKGDLEKALKFLKSSIDYGFTNAEFLENDEDLLSLRNLPEYKQILTDLKKHNKHKD